MGASKNSDYKKCGNILINIKTIRSPDKTYAIICEFCNAEYDQIKIFSQHLEEKHSQNFEIELVQTAVPENSSSLTVGQEIIKVEEQTEANDNGNEKLGSPFTVKEAYQPALNSGPSHEAGRAEEVDMPPIKREHTDTFDENEEYWDPQYNKRFHINTMSYSDEDMDTFQKTSEFTNEKEYTLDDETSGNSKNADEEVNLNDIVKMLKRLDRKVDDIRVQSKKIDVIKDNFEKFKNDMKRQNGLIVTALSENNIAIKNIVNNHSPKFTKMFPIRSVEELEVLENSIDDSNEQEYVATIKYLIGQRGLKKGLADILILDVLVLFNVDGIHNKRRLLDYKKFINILFMGSYEKNSSEKSFKDDLKYALKLAKNRYFKEKTKEKKDMVVDAMVTPIDL